MSIETVQPARSPLTLRSDTPDRDSGVESQASWTFTWTRPYRLVIVAVYALGFVLFDAANLDLGTDRIAAGTLAARGHGQALLGCVFGGWEPTVWPLPPMPSLELGMV